MLYLSQDSGIIIRKIKTFDLMQNIDIDFLRRCIPVKCDKLQSETVPVKTKDDATFKVEDIFSVLGVNRSEERINDPL